MPRQQNKSLLTLAILLVLIAILSGFAIKRRALLDWVALRGYNPPSQVVALAGQDTMTNYAKHILYVNHPAVDDKSTFNKVCPNDGGEKTIVLGCYHSDQQGIFVLDVTDSRLNGVEQVTIAHEMLHAAYDRLSTSERNKVDAMLLNYYNNDLTNERIKATIAIYKKTEPGSVVNEMHSVFGTEVANLPAGLESYYKQYFTNRSQIAAYGAQYQAEFTSRQTTIAADDAQLSNLKTEIDNNVTDLKSKQAQILSQQTQLNDERSSDPAAYNQAVPGYNAQIDSFNVEVEQTQSLTTQYNQLVNSRNAVALEENELSNDLTANVSTINN